MITHDNAANAGAAAALASPWWLPSLHGVSVIAAELLPILGAVWLIVQIAVKLAQYRRSKKQDE